MTRVDRWRVDCVTSRPCDELTEIHSQQQCARRLLSHEWQWSKVVVDGLLASCQRAKSARHWRHCSRIVVHSRLFMLSLCICWCYTSSSSSSSSSNSSFNAYMGEDRASIPMSKIQNYVKYCFEASCCITPKSNDFQSFWFQFYMVTVVIQHTHRQFLSHRLHHTGTKFGVLGFSYSGPAAWNCLPPQLQAIIETFSNDI